MKIKDIAKYVSAALAALVMPLTSLAGDKADIYEIFPVEGGNREADGTGMSRPIEPMLVTEEYAPMYNSDPLAQFSR